MNVLHHHFSESTETDSYVSLSIDDRFETNKLAKNVNSLVEVSPKPTTFTRSFAKDLTEPELLFEATAKAKIWASCVAMRLGAEDRTRIFRQIDRLHDVEEWFHGDKTLSLESFKTLIRSILSKYVGGKPSLALTASGNLTGLWQFPTKRLTIEFLPKDRVKFLFSQTINGSDERIAGDTNLSRLPQVLDPFFYENWFNDG